MQIINRQSFQISIHALRGEGDKLMQIINRQSFQISIHALRGEGDAKIAIPIRKSGVISIHALRGEGDIKKIQKPKKHAKFQSTPSVGRATQHPQKFQQTS